MTLYHLHQRSLNLGVRELIDLGVFDAFMSTWIFFDSYASMALEFHTASKVAGADPEYSRRGRFSNSHTHFSLFIS